MWSPRAAQRCSPALLLLLLHGLVFLQPVTAHRHRRHKPLSSNDDDVLSDDTPDNCINLCEAQFRGEYQVFFQRIYESDFFEVPLDQTIINSTHTLQAFCDRVQTMLECFSRGCHVDRKEWTPERHICVDHYDAFKRAIRCLRKTSLGVHRKCQRVCERHDSFIDSHALDSAIKQSNFSLHDRNESDYYTQMNAHCHFIYCHHHCHIKMIDQQCQLDEQQDAKDVVDLYYRQMHQSDLDNLLEQQRERVFPAFCRSLIPGLDENKFVSGAKEANNRTMQRIEEKILEAVSRTRSSAVQVGVN